MKRIIKRLRGWFKSSPIEVPANEDKNVDVCQDDMVDAENESENESENEEKFEQEDATCTQTSVHKIVHEVIEIPEDVRQYPKGELPEDSKDETLPPMVSQNVLDNKAFLKLVEENCFLLDRLYELAERTSSEESQKTLSFVRKKLRECLINAGLELIDDDREFNLLRHETVGENMGTYGSLIDEFVEPGISLENRVFLKAKVKIKD